MATIMEGARWTLTDAAAERMVANGLIQECYGEHLGVLEVDKPIYHRACNAPDWFGFATIPHAIMSAELHAEEATNAEQALVQPAPDAPE